MANNIHDASGVNYRKNRVKATWTPTAGSNGDTASIGPDIPNNAIIIDVVSHTSTALGVASGTPTIAAAIGGVTVHTAVNYNNAAYADEKVAVNAVNDKTTSAGPLVITIAGGAGDINAGVVDFYIEYMVSLES